MLLRKLLVLSIAVACLIATNTAQATIKHNLRPPHYNGWECIGKQESHNNPRTDTGNGYYGLLQMSYGWMGMIVGKASWYPRLVQMWVAEIESRKYGFSYSWMKGQWPNTYPPCSRFF